MIAAETAVEDIGVALVHEYTAALFSLYGQCEL
jgi:hypothetical protein